MRPPRRGIPLQDRPVAGVSKPRQHCWVTGPEQDPGPFAGLVIQWRHEADGWSALVVYLIPGEPPTTVQTWLPAAQLRPR